MHFCYLVEVLSSVGTPSIGKKSIEPEKWFTFLNLASSQPIKLLSLKVSSVEPYKAHQKEYTPFQTTFVSDF